MVWISFVVSVPIDQMLPAFRSSRSPDIYQNIGASFFIPKWNGLQLLSLSYEAIIPFHSEIVNRFLISFLNRFLITYTIMVQ